MRSVSSSSPLRLNERRGLQSSLPPSVLHLLCEVVRGLTGPGREQLLLHPRVVTCKVAHRPVGGQAVDGGIWLGIGVQVPEAVDPDEVEGVEVLSACGVAGMVRVREDVVVDDDARPGLRGDVVVAPLDGGGRIHVAQVCIDRLLDGVGPAEGADDPLLLPRVLRLASSGGPLRRPLRRRERQRRDDLPAGVPREESVRVEPGPFRLDKYVLTVRGTARPVHQLLHPEAAGIEHGDPASFGDEARDCVVLLRVHVPLERHDDAAARLVLRVSVCRVQHGTPGEGVVEVFHELLRGVVGVEGEHRARRDVRQPPQAVLQGAAHESSVVLGPLAVVLRHRGVLRHALRRPHRVAQALDELLEGEGGHPPCPGGARPPRCNGQVSGHLLSSR